jgi:hypothetical protein
MSAESAQPRQPLPLKRIAVYGLIAVIGSVVVNLIIRAIGVAIIDVAPEFGPLADPTGTVIFTTVLVLIAVIVFAIVDRKAGNPVRMFNIIALIALIVSFVPDILLLVSPESAPFPGATPAAVIILMLQHVAAYAITVYTLTVLAYRR